MSVIADRMEDLRRALMEWIDKVSDYNLIEDDQWSPAPDDPFFTFSLVTQLVRLGSDTVTYSEADNSFIKVGQRRVTVSLKAKGKEPDSRDRMIRGTDMLADVEWTSDRPDIQEIFQHYNIALAEMQPIVDTTVFEDNSAIPRATLDLIFHISVREVIDLTHIETVGIKGNVDADGDGNFETEIPIEIDLNP